MKGMCVLTLRGNAKQSPAVLVPVVREGSCCSVASSLFGYCYLVIFVHVGQGCGLRSSNSSFLIRLVLLSIQQEHFMIWMET